MIIFLLKTMTEPNKLPTPIPNEINHDERVIVLSIGKNEFELDLTGWGDVLLKNYENWPSDEKNIETDSIIKDIANMFPGKPKYEWVDK